MPEMVVFGRVEAIDETHGPNQVGKFVGPDGPEHDRPSGVGGGAGGVLGVLDFGVEAGG